MSIVKEAMYQFACIDSYTTSSMFEIVYLQQNLTYLIKYCIHLVIPDMEVVNNFEQEQDFVARFCLI